MLGKGQPTLNPTERFRRIGLLSQLQQSFLALQMKTPEPRLVYIPVDVPAVIRKFDALIEGTKGTCGHPGHRLMSTGPQVAALISNRNQTAQTVRVELCRERIRHCEMIRQCSLHALLATSKHPPSKLCGPVMTQKLRQACRRESRLGQIGNSLLQVRPVLIVSSNQDSHEPEKQCTRLNCNDDIRSQLGKRRIVNC